MIKPLTTIQPSTSLTSPLCMWPDTLDWFRRLSPRPRLQTSPPLHLYFSSSPVWPLFSFSLLLLSPAIRLQAPPPGCRPRRPPRSPAPWPASRFHRSRRVSRGSASRRPRLRTAIRWCGVFLQFSVCVCVRVCVCADYVSCGTENPGEKGLQRWLGDPRGSDHSGPEDRLWILWNCLQGKVAW